MGAGVTDSVHQERSLHTGVCDAHVHALLISALHFSLSGATWGAI